jgi:hypothetical protein
MRVNTRLFICFVFFISSNQETKSQITENFSDGELSSQPAWFGNIPQWMVLNGVLQSNDTVPTSSFYLYTPSQLVKNTVWQITIQLKFNTSSANYVDIYLAADDSSFSTAIKNGYFVRVGGTKDEICLYKKSNGTSVLLIDGLDGTTNKSTSTISLKVSCDESYNWNLERDLTGGQTYQSEGNTQDSSLIGSQYFGLFVTQSTSSFFQKHFFDNISVASIVRDTTPPSLLSAIVKTKQTIQLTFSEALDSSWDTIQNNIRLYDSLNTELQLDSVRKDLSNPRIYYLYTQEKLTGIDQLLIRFIKDGSGNEAKDSIHISIKWAPALLASFKQIVITELMADPSPPVGLPETEYIELLNTSPVTFDLKDYALSDPSTTVLLPSYAFAPNSYVIVCKQADSADFRVYGNVVSLPSMPSLNNEGDRITLRNSEQLLVDNVEYALSWYQDKNKEDGGYSLELIDPTNLCAASMNWKASTHVKGGTPGAQNSIFGQLIDSLPPLLLSATVLSPTLLKLVFSEKMDSSSLVKSNFSFSKGLAISSSSWKSDSLSQLLLACTNPLTTRTSYLLSLSHLKDCAGNEAPPSSVSIALTEPAVSGDILLNEVLFNPFTGGSDFVEVYNASPKYLDLNGWMLANLNSDTVANKKALFKNSFLFEPDSYLAFTTNKPTILTYYPKARMDNVLEVPSMPSYPDDQGSVLLLAANGSVMDQFDYMASMHSPLLSNKEGVSLEKINPSWPSNDGNNWASASKEQGYASPGYQNSQLLGVGMSQESVSVEPQVITPNGDGDRDFLVISIQLDQISNIGSIIIYDVLGREVKRLLKHSLSGTHSYVQWDGTNESNEAVALGHYIIWIELFNKEGNVVHNKRKAVVGEKF